MLERLETYGLLLLVAWNHNFQKILVLDRNTWNHITVQIMLLHWKKTSYQLCKKWNRNVQCIWFLKAQNYLRLPDMPLKSSIDLSYSNRKIYSVKHSYLII